MMEYVLRHFVEGDRNFILNSFSKCYYKQYPMQFVPTTIYFNEMEKYINKLLERAHCMLMVFPEDANEIMGYVIYEYSNDVPVIHFIYIKYDFLRKGIGREVVKKIVGDSVVCIYTHMFDNMKKLKYKINNLKWIYDPFLPLRTK